MIVKNGLNRIVQNNAIELLFFGHARALTTNRRAKATIEDAFHSFLDLYGLTEEELSFEAARSSYYRNISRLKSQKIAI